MDEFWFALCAAFLKCLARERFGALDIAQRRENLADCDPPACYQLCRTKLSIRLKATFHRLQCRRVIASKKLRPSNAFKREREFQWVVIFPPQFQALFCETSRLRAFTFPIENHTQCPKTACLVTRAFVRV